jgi:hypothetical protein
MKYDPIPLYSNPDVLNKEKEDEKKKVKKQSMTTIFLIPDSPRYKKQIIKREKETKKVMKERELTKETKPTKTNHKTPLIEVKKAPSFPSKGK